MSEGIIYVFVNEAMPGYVKIGKTTNLEQRLKQLYSTPVPLPFECIYAAKVADMQEGLCPSFARRNDIDIFQSLTTF